jgi:hypothetical protein
MKKQLEGSEIRDRFGSAGGDEARESVTLLALQAIGIFAAILTVAVACGVLLAGCGTHSDSSAQADAGAQVTSEGPGVQAEAASATPTPANTPGGLSVSDVAIREGLPPDLTVSVSDTLVTPGQTVEFIAQGTTDVARIMVSDGRDDPMALARAEGTDTWRGQYRVPLHPRHERFGISVTALTEADRWRRVWVFLRVEPNEPPSAVSAPEDSVSHDE